MRDFKIPTPTFKICQSQKEGIDFLRSQKEGEWFIKASGLTAGKGALYAQNKAQAKERIKQMKNFGASGGTFLIEECLRGEEFSSFAVLDGEYFVLVGHAQDHKTLYNGDIGPNTGGMGSSSPPLVITTKVEKQIGAIFQKVASGLVVVGRPYRGVLYLGGMIDNKEKVSVIEFNARWGDPEAQVIIPSIKNDLYQLAQTVIAGEIRQLKIKKDNLYRIAVCAASRGYPVDHHDVIGKQIYGLVEIKKIKQVKVFTAAIKKSNGQYLASGGRLFYVMAAAKNVAQACQIAYNALSLANVEGNNLHYRTDIGYRDLERYYKRR